MHLPRYQAIASADFLDYEFNSEGAKDSVRKFVQFVAIADQSLIYNTAFGDFDPVQNEVNDLVVTNNGDRDTVLATLAFILDDFSGKHQKPLIQIEGSTPSRTRLYQTAIASFWQQLHRHYSIQGWYHNAWHHFRIGRNYNRFLLRKK